MRFKNKNRGYQKLRVWEDAIEFYAETSAVYRRLDYELKRVASNQLASADSVHRNIAEGYCRRSIKEYIQYLYYALGSLGESVSSLEACCRAAQISDTDYERLNGLAYKMENALLKLVEALEAKRDKGDWVDHMVVRESNAAYVAASSDSPALHHSSTPSLQSSTTPPLHHSTAPTEATFP